MSCPPFVLGSLNISNGTFAPGFVNSKAPSPKTYVVYFVYAGVVPDFGTSSVGMESSTNTNLPFKAAIVKFLSIPSESVYFKYSSNFKFSKFVAI